MPAASAAAAVPKPRAHYVPPPMEQSLAKLSWLQSRAQPDFKGHTPMPQRPKTMSEINRDHANAAKKLPNGGDRFVPSTRSRNHISVDTRFQATQVNTVRPFRTAEELVAEKENIETEFELNAAQHRANPNHPHRNPFKQEVDPMSNRPIFYEALSYNETDVVASAPDGTVGGKRKGRRIYPERGSRNIIGGGDATTSGGEAARPLLEDVREVGAEHRLQILREDAMRHPLFTKDTKIAHATTHWDPMSQLLAHGYSDRPPASGRVEDPNLAKRRANSARSAEAIRSRRAAPKAWR